jgi:hypothetical protein
MVLASCLLLICMDNILSGTPLLCVSFGADCFYDFMNDPAGAVGGRH